MYAKLTSHAIHAHRSASSAPPGCRYTRLVRGVWMWTFGVCVVTSYGVGALALPRYLGVQIRHHFCPQRHCPSHDKTDRQST
ncbi:hypothetical protein IQ06DRAFT_143158 [Phaeosphaeriaceae sp. SRC1lsM3a]|nr:hypothetical protein IQ06DRAFT_143158 [Stagonospora sp. SRC1lsM3a]